MTRWLAILMLLALPALAQPEKDPENLPPVTPDPSGVPRDAVPASQTNAESAEVSPAESKTTASRQGCSDSNPCATPTPASR